jgi:hypothetical protein
VSSASKRGHRHQNQPVLVPYQDSGAGDDEGDIAGESSLVWSCVATSVNGAGLGPAGSFDFVGPVPGGVLDSVSSSGMVGQYVLRTCLSAGRRMGLERKKSIPESRHS